MAATQEYLQQRAGGVGSSVGNTTSYLNPTFSSARSMNQWGNSVVGQAQQSGYMFGTNANNTHYHGTAPGGSTPGAYNVSLPGMGGGVGAGSGGAGQSSTQSIDALTADFTTKMQAANQTVAQQMPQVFQAPMAQVAQESSQKLAGDQGGIGQKLATLTQETATDKTAKESEANTQIAQDYAMKMQQATSQATAGAGGGGIGSILGGGGGGGMGGIGQIFGIGQQIFSSFFKNGGVVGSSGGIGKSVPASAFSGAPSMKIGGIVGDPAARPIIAHEGELVTPKHQVDAMRRMGRGAALVDNAPTTASKSAPTPVATHDPANESRQGSARPVVNNWNIVTPDAASFKASQSQINAKAGAAYVRDARRNN